MRSYLLEDFTSGLSKPFVEHSQELMEKTPVWQDQGVLQKCVYFKEPARNPSEGGCFNKSQREGKSSFDLQNLNGACPLQVVRLKCLG